MRRVHCFAILLAFVLSMAPAPCGACPAQLAAGSARDCCGPVQGAIDAQCCTPAVTGTLPEYSTRSIAKAIAVGVRWPALTPAPETDSRAEVALAETISRGPQPRVVLRT
jgi:hypothetical protein